MPFVLCRSWWVLGTDHAGAILAAPGFSCIYINQVPLISRNQTILLAELRVRLLVCDMLWIKLHLITISLLDQKDDFGEDWSFIYYGKCPILILMKNPYCEACRAENIAYKADFGVAEVKPVQLKKHSLYSWPDPTLFYHSCLATCQLCADNARPQMPLQHFNNNK